MKIIVTGVGGEIGIGIVQSLRMSKFKDLKIIGVDTNELSSSFFRPVFLDKWYIVPSALNKNFISKIMSICKKNHVDFIFPGNDNDVLALSQTKTIFQKLGVNVMVSDQNTIKICRDKLLTYQTTNKHIPFVKTIVPSDNINNIRFPVFLKSRTGWGSKNVFKVNDKEELQIFSKRIEKPIIQEFLSGEEYTVDVIVDKNSKFLTCVPRKRIKVVAGVSYISKTVKDNKINEIAKRLSKILQFKGPFNFQLRKSNNKIQVFEINPRFGGTSVLTTFAGINMPELAIRSVLGKKISTKFDFKNNFCISRFLDGTMFTNE